VTVDTPLSILNNNVGFDLGKIKISQGSQTAIIDLGRPELTTVADMISAINTSGLEITASINEAGSGIQIVSTVANKSLFIENYDDTRTATSLGIVGASDMIGTLMIMANALRNNERDIIEQMNGNIDLAIDELLKTQASVGTSTIRMESTQSRLESTRITVTKLLSEVEDADLVQVASDLAKQENLYQAALLASSKVMQQSLVDFLR
jgi:flagellar hook-associated protein 3 FlgL